MGKGTITTLCCYLAIQNFSLAENASAARFNLDSSTDFIEEKTSVFAMNNRVIDPFGKPQDPNKKVVIPTKTEPTKPTTTITKEQQQILIEQEITKLAKKLTVMGRRVIIGDDNYARGDKINISVKGKTFPLKFNSITSRKITFLDLSDTSIISLDMKRKSVIPRHSDKPTNKDPNIIPTIKVEE